MDDQARRLKTLQMELEATLEPFIQAKRQILNISVPKMVIDKNGTWEFQHSPHVMEQLGRIDKNMKEMKDLFMKRHKLV